ncbi:MAG: hypothetical protein WA816_01310 [Bacteroidales bacterium]
MLNTRKNIRVFNFDSIIVVVIVFFALLIYSNSVGKTTDLKRKPASTFISVSEKNAVFTPIIRLQVFQKTWISNKNHFCLLAFNRNQISENKKTDIKVNHLEILRENSHKIPRFILRYHLFPLEKDEPPILS